MHLTLRTSTRRRLGYFDWLLLFHSSLRKVLFYFTSLHPRSNWRNCRVEFVPVCEKNIGTRRVRQMENIFVRELTVKLADEMEMYETCRMRDEMKG